MNVFGRCFRPNQNHRVTSGTERFSRLSVECNPTAHCTGRRGKSASDRQDLEARSNGRMQKLIDLGGIDAQNRFTWLYQVLFYQIDRDL